MLVARGDTIEENKAHFASSLQSKGNSQHDNDADRSIRSRIDLDNERLFGRHVRSLFKKRAINFQRDKKAWCCTTILPVVFSTLGFMLFYFATPDRNLSSITLDLGMLNPEILSTPVNPISVNSPNNPFTCQPGNCAYIPIIEVAETGEIYTFCGSQANLEAPIEGSNSIPDKNLCSIAESFEILATLNDFNGAVAVEANVQNIGNVSQGHLKRNR